MNDGSRLIGPLRLWHVDGRRHTVKFVLAGPVDEARFLGLELVASAFQDAKSIVTPAGPFAGREQLAA